MILPKISIIMPVLNRADTIEKAIRSVLKQDYDNVELIILDGGSKDGTLEIIQNYKAYITYWHSQADGGAAVATNFGIQKATGDLVALLMADDWYEPGLFQKIAEAYQANPDADMFTCGGRLVSFDAKTKSYVTQKTFSTAKELKLNFYNICFATSAICFRFIKKSFYNRIGLYIPLDENGKQNLTNDKEFLLRALLHQAKDVFINEVGYTYFAHKESFSFSNNRANSIRHAEEHMAIVKNYLATKKLSLKQKLFLIHWYNDQATRLFFYKLLQRKFSEAFKVAKQNVQKYPFIWPLQFLHTTCQMLMSGFKKISKKSVG